MSRDPLARVLLDAVIALVPQWYAAPYGPNRQTIHVAGESAQFFSQRGSSKELGEWLEIAQGRLQSWHAVLEQFQPSAAAELVQEDLAVEWLTITHPGVVWRDVLRHAQAASARTHENEPVTFNIMIGTEPGDRSIADPKFTKVLERIGASPQVVVRVDRKLQFVRYEEIPDRQIYESAAIGCNPWFLQHYVSKLEPGECSVHLTADGDFVVTNREGLVASRRKRRWHLYDLDTFANAMIDVLSSARKGAHASRCVSQDLAAWITQGAFDLSYRRHGALLIYDPEQVVARNFVHNVDSIIGQSSDSWYAVVGKESSDISSAASQSAVRRRFLELASMDGAVLFDDRRILGFGSMIKAAPDAGSHAGARTTAAHSAYRWGGVPVKVSADGDITVLFRTSNGHSSGDASLHYL